MKKYNKNEIYCKEFIRLYNKIKKVLKKNLAKEINVQAVNLRWIVYNFDHLENITNNNEFGVALKIKRLLSQYSDSDSEQKACIDLVHAMLSFESVIKNYDRNNMYKKLPNIIDIYEFSKIDIKHIGYIDMVTFIYDIMDTYLESKYNKFIDFCNAYATGIYHNKFNKYYMF